MLPEKSRFLQNMAQLYDAMKSGGDTTVIMVTRATTLGSPGDFPVDLFDVFAVKLTRSPPEVKRLSEERAKMVENKTTGPNLI